MPRLLVLGSATCAVLVVCGGAPRPAAGEDGKRGASVYSRRAAAHLAAAAAAAAPPAGESGGEEAAQAERIVASSLARIGRAETVAIRLRQRVRLGDRVLVGVGRYLQAGQGEEQRFRFETSLTSDSESFEITEVSDGIFCWLHRRTGPDPATLHRIDIQRVRNRLEELGAPDPADTAPYLGGLQRNLWWIRQWFRFQEAVAGEIDGRPVWIVEGRWQAAMLKFLLPDVVAAAGPEGEIRPEQLPDGFPWAVRLAVGQSDLLPYRFEFLGVPGERPVAPAPPEPIAVVEFLEVVLDGEVDATAFYYQPASEELVDFTGPTIKMMGLMRP
ncbi:MAG: hypothetical protein ACKOCX_04085 [Planctomycetota bacterium]